MKWSRERRWKLEIGGSVLFYFLLLGMLFRTFCLLDKCCLTKPHSQLGLFKDGGREVLIKKVTEYRPEGEEGGSRVAPGEQCCGQKEQPMQRWKTNLIQRSAWLDQSGRGSEWRSKGREVMGPHGLE
jgi:hypothetical protein